MNTIDPKELAKALIAKKLNMQPCDEGDYVHIYMRQGCYKVLGTTSTGFKVLMCGTPTWLTWSQYKCHKGGANPIQTMKTFTAFLLKVQAK